MPERRVPIPEYWQPEDFRIPGMMISDFPDRRFPEVGILKKIRRHKKHILNAISYGMNNARVEATNNKIKLIVCKVYGSRNLGNMLDMVYLVCSNLRVPLPNRKPKLA